MAFPLKPFAAEPVDFQGAIPPEVAEFIRRQKPVEEMHQHSVQAAERSDLDAALASDRQNQGLGYLAQSLQRSGGLIRGEKSAPVAIPGLDDSMKEWLLKRQIGQQDEAASAGRVEGARKREQEAADFALRTYVAGEGERNRTSRVTEQEQERAHRSKEGELERASREKLARIAAARPAGGGGHGAFLPPDSISAIVDGIARGDLPPNLAPYRSNASAIAAGLAERGVDVARLGMNYAAELKNIAAMNSTQQARLRGAIGTLYHTIDGPGGLTESYAAWKQKGLDSRFPLVNRAAISAAKAAGIPEAQRLETLINDMIAEQAQVYMAGGTPTDHALKLAEENLNAAWNGKTFDDLVGLLRQNLKFRSMAMQEINAAGIRGENPYVREPQNTSGKPAAVPGADAAPTTIRVRRKSDGKTGSMPAASFNPDLYEKIQ